MRKKERFQRFIEYFKEHRPNAETELNYSNPYELLVAVILSAQCTDKRVNLITPKLFHDYPDAHALATAEPEDIFTYIRSCTYPNNKSKHLVNMARMLVNGFGNVVPSEQKDLMKLPGVGRKTANVISSVIFDKPAMAVDTHVFRVAARIGLSTNSKTPLDTEKQLVKYIPDDLIPLAHHWLILHGRYVCMARKPKCEECGLIDFCKFFSRKESSK
ncbi:MAG: endonuclease III [Hyphomicrobiales bacterium]